MTTNTEILDLSEVRREFFSPKPIIGGLVEDFIIMCSGFYCHSYLFSYL